MILISHRPSKVKMVDRILVIENDYVIESSTHNDLISADNTNAELFNRQSPGCLPENAFKI